MSSLDDAMVRQFGVTHINGRDITVKKERKPRSKNRMRCAGCNQFDPLHLATCHEVARTRFTKDERKALNEALCARIELVREMVVAIKGALVQVESHLDHLEAKLEESS